MLFTEKIDIDNNRGETKYRLSVPERLKRDVNLSVFRKVKSNEVLSCTVFTKVINANHVCHKTANI